MSQGQITLEVQEKKKIGKKKKRELNRKGERHRRFQRASMFNKKSKTFFEWKQTSTNPSTPGVTTTPPHPKYQNNNINNTQMKMSENYLTES